MSFSQYLNCKTLLVFGALLTIGSLIGMIVSLDDPQAGCPCIDCVYELYDMQFDNETLYGYFYIINNRTGCGRWCSDNRNISTCPINNSTCEVTRDVKRYCYYQGFQDLFGCYNYAKYAWSIVCITLFVCAVLSVIIAGVNLWRNYLMSRYYQPIQ